MCGRMIIDDDWFDRAPDELTGALNRRPLATGEIHPGGHCAVLAPGRSGQIRAFDMRWGLSEPERRMILHARSETADRRSLFAPSLARRRCAVPARAYLEWNRSSRNRYRVRSRDGLTWIAGLYRAEADGLAAFAVLTRTPTAGIAFIHDRMPLLLPEALVTSWLSGAAASDIFAGAQTDVVWQADGNEQLSLSF